MENKKFNRYTITAALPYANGPLHIGHMAGVYVPADTYVRYLRQRGKDVLFIGGSDEHGVPVTLRAAAEGISVQEVVDKYHNVFKESFQKFGISFDVYSRTSSPVHHETASEMFKHMEAEGKFTVKTSEQYYDPQAQQFLADRLIKGECPNCHFPEAYGDQCENCGKSLSPDDLINPYSSLSNSALTKKETKHWFLPLDQYEDWLRKWILEGHKEDWKPNVYGQCKSWIDQGLQPRAMTRDLDWGIPVPTEGGEGKVLYVWFDAPIGYISATKEYFQDKQNPEGWKEYWQSEDSRLIHFIGKDNIVFHCIIFPVILKAHGGYVLPDNVPSNEFMNLEGKKLSTSKNWAVWLHEYLEEFPGKCDVLRYVLTSNAPDTKDSDFTWKDFQNKNNSELVATFGNFVNRAISLTHRYFEGKVPPQNKLDETDLHLEKNLAALPDLIAQAIEQFRFREALALLMDVARLGNQYMQKTEPWQLYKKKEENEGRIQTILNISLQLCANLGILAEAFLPEAAAKLRAMLHLSDTSWEQAGSLGILKAGADLEKAELLFEKIDDKQIEAQMQKLQGPPPGAEEEASAAEPAEAVEVPPFKEEIAFDDFMKMDIRVATVMACEKVKKSNKLLKFTLDTGIDQRTVLSGIAKHYKPEELIGKQVVLLANLAPRKMMGLVSQGMILSAEDSEGNLRLLKPNEVVNSGSTVS